MKVVVDDDDDVDVRNKNITLLLMYRRYGILEGEHGRGQRWKGKNDKVKAGKA